MKITIPLSAAAPVRARWTLPLSTLMLGLALMGAVSSARADTFTVLNTDDTGDGSLRQAIEDANTAPTDDDIVFDAEIFANKQTITVASQLVINDGKLSINAPAAGVVISGGGNTRVFRVNSGVVEMSGLIISNGNSFDSGGGIVNIGTLTLTNSTVSGNSAPYFGGGIYNDGTLTLTNSTVSGNSTQFRGGGIHNNGTLSLSNATLSGNSAQDGGGGIYNNGTLSLFNATLSGNSAQGYNGGIYNDGPFNATNTLFAANGINPFRGFVDPGTTGDANHNYSFGTLAAAGLDSTLKNNGGPTLTVALLEGSPVIDQGLTTILATDQRGAGYPRSFGEGVDVGAFEVQAPNNAPTDIALSNDSVEENSDTGTSVGSFSSTDADSGDSFTYTLVGEENDNAQFTIEGDTLKTAASFDFEDKSSYTIGVQTDDGKGGTFEKEFTINVANVNEEAPSLVVTTTEDVVAEDGQTSLREAVNYANTKEDDSAISFDAEVFAQKETITLSSTLSIESANKVSIVGSPAGVTLKVVDGDGAGFDGEGSLLNIRSGSDVTVRALTLADSNAAIFNVGTLSVYDSTFTGNGTGLLNLSGTSKVFNSTFSGNDTGLITVAGFFYSGDSALVVVNSTISGNATGVFNYGNYEGGFGDNNGDPTFTSTLTLRNSLVVGNETNTNGDITDGGGNLTTGSAEDAGLGELADNGGPTDTFALLPGSPAINAGDNQNASGDFDQRGAGFARIKGGTVDIGAFEVQNTPPVVAPVISPSAPNIKDTVTVNPNGSDADGDDLTYSYRFEINGEPVEVDGHTPNTVDLSTLSVKVGDVLKVTVTANDGQADSEPVSISVELVAQPVSLKAVTDLKATPSSGTGANNVKLKWTDNSLNESGYKVIRQTGVNGKAVLIARIETPDLTSFVDNNVEPGVTYFYRVRPFKVRVSDGPDSNIASATVPQTILKAPTNLSAQANAQGTAIALNWTDNSQGESGYKVVRRTGLNGQWIVVSRGMTPNQTSYLDTDVEEGVTYFYRVRAYKVRFEDGPYSNTVSATVQKTVLRAPVLSAALSADGASVELNWTDTSTGESGYKIVRRASDGTTVEILRGTTPDQTNFVDNTIVPGTTYTYRVRAYRVRFNDGAYSNSVTVTPPSSDGAPSGGSGGSS